MPILVLHWILTFFHFGQLFRFTYIHFPIFHLQNRQRLHLWRFQIDLSYAYLISYLLWFLAQVWNFVCCLFKNYCCYVHVFSNSIDFQFHTEICLYVRYFYLNSNQVPTLSFQTYIANFLPIFSINSFASIFPSKHVIHFFLLY